jgi:hypothetical protein
MLLPTMYYRIIPKRPIISLIYSPSSLLAGIRCSSARSCASKCIRTVADVYALMFFSFVSEDYMVAIICDDVMT